MNRKIPCLILIFLMFVMLISSGAFAATGGVWGDNVFWALSDGILTISGEGEMKKADADNSPPWMYLDGIEKIVIDDGITTIPDFIFFGMIDDDGELYGTADVKSIEIPASVTEISEYAFMYCQALDEIIVSPENRHYSSDSQGILYNKEKTYLIHIPGAKAGTVNIPETTTDIFMDSLDTAYYIENITVSAENPQFASDEQGGLYDKDMNSLLIVPRNYPGAFVISDGVSQIGFGACWNCSALTEVLIPDGVVKINDYAFYNCHSLRTVHIPKTVTSIPEGGFGECVNIEDVYYGGNRFEWENVEISPDNTYLTSANIHYTCAHTSAEEVFPATCVDAAVIYCGECNKNYPSGDPLGHSYGEWTEIGGAKERKCLVCGHVEICRTGDVNKDGEINALDATQILRYANGKSSVLDTMTETEQLSFGDVNNDGSVNALDATQILRYANGKSSVLRMY